MEGPIAGFEWDRGNRAKCLQHGVSAEEVGSVFLASVTILPDEAHSLTETRFKGIGRTASERHIFVVFTIREKKGQRYIRPITARYMHNKEVQHYEKENPDL